jgi:hypothetical protein
MEFLPQSKSGYNCPFCTHEFKLKFNYDRHVGFCEFASKSRKERENEIDSFDTCPSLNELFCYVKELTVRVSNLEKENAKLKVFANREKQKMDILQWLNEKSSCKPPMTFTIWFTSLNFKKCLEDVFNEGLVYGIIKMFEYGVTNISINDTQNLPIRAFSQKKNTFYIFDKVIQEDGSEKNQWIIITNTNFDRCLKYIENRFLEELKNWYEENKLLIDNNESLKLKYFDYSDKVLGGKLNGDTRYQRVKNSVFNKISQNFKNIVEYEFE